ncbi:M12 family metallopeptidase [Catalinimonas niigatensis]|uniref:M12 family metallopeptidase n=1 Tax=Catalinimonas niigatensis TaxID=1397264 RepID=UPI0026666D49|nr:M12 family metallopeptidase [Catalinimonas niigatensis]WPP52969.1 M12 family metallopeptidase [Catalinimonas niigatensis]
MAKRKKNSKPQEGLSKENPTTHYCSMPIMPPRIFDVEVDPFRAAAIIVTDNKWVNGTVIHYYFFDQDTDGEFGFTPNGEQVWRSWVGSEDQQNVIREAFNIWKEIGIGLEFQEVDNREDAEVRIGFLQGDGTWSYLGTYVLNIGAGQRTMNYGWGLTGQDGLDTALHEIGHTLGFPHEHQNPNAGIVWDEEAVYTALAQPPNNWPRDTTYHNIIRKIDPDTVQGSNWDPNSIMHYPFGPGLILQPEEYGRNGIYPEPGLSERDMQWIKTFYPPLEEEMEELKPFQSKKLSIKATNQVNYVIVPKATRMYNIRTFGESDTVLVLFEDEGGEWRYRSGDDDSGKDYNAHLRYRLIKGRRYIIRARLYYQHMEGNFAIMMW